MLEPAEPKGEAKSHRDSLPGHQPTPFGVGWYFVRFAGLRLAGQL